MTPAFHLLANPTSGSTNITALINARLTKLTVTDKAGIEIDTLSIDLDNGAQHPEGAIEPPPTGATLDLSLGYAETGLTAINRFVVTGLTYKGPPDTLTINAGSAALLGTIKAPRTQSWHDTTIGTIVRTIADRHGLTARVGVPLTTTAIPHLDQRAQSDLAFLADIAKRYDAVVKLAEGNLVLTPTSTSTTVSGSAIAPITIDASAITTYSLQIADRQLYKSATASYRTDFGTVATATAGSGTPAYETKSTHSNAAYAHAAANAALRRLAYGTQNLTLTLPGNPALFAEHPIRITGLVAPVADHTWIIAEAKHTLTTSGLTTSLSCHRG
ncbi:MAG: hypothetical protein K0U36_06805 [Alphaproteobacteria bacterium]|nr:hypothetical protein [Alphaproteobacteria bacterium]